MGVMLSEGWCHAREDKSSVVVCPFHALEFDGEGCTILPGSKKKTLSQLKPLELIIQGDFIWSYDGYELKVPIPNIESFIDGGHQSHAFYNLPTSPTNLKEKLSNPDLLLLPKVIKAHLENHFPFLVIAHVENWLGKVAQVHLFVPESKTQT
jgi:hypothetical protein